MSEQFELGLTTGGSRGQKVEWCRNVLAVGDVHMTPRDGIFLDVTAGVKRDPVGVMKSSCSPSGPPS